MPRHQWTPEQARLWAPIGAQKANRSQKRKDNLALKRAERALKRRPTPPERQLDFQAQSVLRLRRLIVRLHYMLALEEDPAKLDRLAAAVDKLSQQECWLSGRPRPGIRKAPREDLESVSIDALPVPQPPPELPMPTPASDDHQDSPLAPGSNIDDPAPADIDSSHQQQPAPADIAGNRVTEGDDHQHAPDSTIEGEGQPRPG